MLLSGPVWLGVEKGTDGTKWASRDVRSPTDHQSTILEPYKPFLKTCLETLALIQSPNLCMKLPESENFLAHA